MRASEWSGFAGAADAVELQVSYEAGDQTSKNHLLTLNPVLVPALGCSRAELFEGFLNLRSDGPVVLPSPAVAGLGGFMWHFVPVLLGQVGVVARRSDSGNIPFLEVFACEKLNSVLRLNPGNRLKIHLLPGRYLDLAA